jgi:hypothetical protein
MNGSSLSAYDECIENHLIELVLPSALASVILDR